MKCVKKTGQMNTTSLTCYLLY